MTESLDKSPAAIVSVRSTTLSLLAAVVASMIGFLFYNVMPLYLGVLQDATAMSMTRIGFVGSAFFFGLNIVSASSFFWIRRVPVRAISLLAMIVMCIFLGMSAYVTTYAFIIFAIMVVGGASGILTVVAATIIGDDEQSTRWYGLKTAAESAGGVLLLFVLPSTLILAFGIKGAVLGVFILMIMTAPILLFLRKERLDAVPTGQADEKLDVHVDLANSEIQSDSISRSKKTALDFLENRSVWFELLAMVLFFVGGSAIWAFEERIANTFAFDAVWVGRVLGFSLFFAVIGPIIASAIGQRFGFRLPYFISSGVMILGVFLIAYSLGSPGIFAAGACLFMLGWGGGLPFLFSMISADDPNGRYISLSIPALGLGAMLGPGSAGLLLDGGSIEALKWFVVAVLSSSVGAVWFSKNDPRR